MLRSLRDGAKSGFMKFILLGFMAMAVGGLVLTDVGGFFRGGISNNVVAKGKGIEITAQSFDNTVRRVLARQGMTPQEAYQMGIINQILSNEVQVRLLAREAHKKGLVVGDATVTQEISKLAANLTSGDTSKADALKQVLRSQGISEEEFIQSIRQELGNNLFRNALLSGSTKISEAEAKDLYQFRNERRNFNALVMKNEDVSGVDAPNDEQLQKYYETNKQDFAIPETRDFTIATLKKEMLSDQVEISEDDLRAAYADNIVAYQRPARRQLEQAILNTQGDAQDVFTQVEKGKSLERAVKNITGKNTGYLGENKFEQGGLLEEIATPVFEAEKDALLGPIQTALGWHVIKVQEILEPQTESFESVKATLKDDLLQLRLMDELVNAANTLDDQLAGGEALEVVVKEMGLTTEEFKEINQAGLNAAGKDSLESYQGDKAQILEAAFDFDVGESSPVLEMADGRFITVHVDAVKPLSYQEFASVKAGLESRWMEEEKRLDNKVRAEEVLAKLAAGATLEDVAKEMSAKIQPYTNLMRVAEPKAPLTFSGIRKIFEAKPNETIKLESSEGFIIGQVSAVTLPPLDAKAMEEIAKLREEAGEAQPQEILSQYVGYLSEKYKVQVNDNVLRTLYGTQQAVN